MTEVAKQKDYVPMKGIFGGVCKEQHGIKE